MSCPAGQCGVGGWGGPLPGDPSNNSVLSATPAFGGIEVSWNLPTTNPHAVAYTKLWRALTSDFNAATLRAEVAGTSYFDRIDTPTLYYYWIQIVSVNGTVGELIGPVSAVAKPTIEAMIELLTGEIDAGLLATTLKEKLDEIVLLRNDLQSEVVDRETGETTLAEAIADVEAGIAEAHTFILNETATRTSENSAIVEQLTGVAATLDSEIAAVQTLLQANIDTLSGTVSALQTTQTAVQGRLTTAEGDIDVLAGTQTTQQASINSINGTISTMQSTQTGFQTSLNGYAGVQTTLTTNLNTLTGTVNAMYTAKVDVNGLIGGFGLTNNGTTVEAGFDVDKFWIGRTTNKVKPFIITGSTVFISSAVIPTITASMINGLNLVVRSGDYTAWAFPPAGSSGFYLGPSGFLVGDPSGGKYVRITAAGNIDMPGFSVTNGTAVFSGTGTLSDGAIAGIQINATDIRSTNYVANTSGFMIQSNGNAWFNNITAKGNITADNLDAATGTFAGTLTAGAVNAVNTVNIAGQAVTVTASAELSGETPIDSGSSYTTICSTTLNTGGSPVVVIAAAFTSPGTASTVDVRVVISGAEERKITYVGGTTPLIALKLSPGTGSFTISLQGRASAGSLATAKVGSAFAAIGCKR